MGCSNSRANTSLSACMRLAFLSHFLLADDSAEERGLKMLSGHFFLSFALIFKVWVEAIVGGDLNPELGLSSSSSDQF